MLGKSGRIESFESVESIAKFIIVSLIGVKIV
jgi:hypothetical protein